MVTARTGGPESQPGVCGDRPLWEAVSEHGRRGLLDLPVLQCCQKAGQEAGDTLYPGFPSVGGRRKVTLIPWAVTGGEDTVTLGL